MSDTTKQVKARLAVFTETFNARNVKDHLAIFTDDVLIMPHGGGPIIGKNAVEQKLKGVLASPDKHTLHLDEIEVLDDADRATSSDRFTGKHASGKERKGKSVKTWRKIDGDWFCSAFFWTHDSNDDIIVLMAEKNAGLCKHWNENSLDKFEEMYSAEPTLLPQGAPAITGRKAVMEAIRGMQKAFPILGLETMRAEQQGPNVIAQWMKMTLFDKEHKLLASGGGMSIWKKEEGDFKLHWDQLYTNQQ